jgi:hypothetical protein
MLVSAWGKRWQEVQLVMSSLFTAYIDDSGTDPSQKVAIATGLIIPAKKIISLENEWNTFREKWGFSCFHMSEFSAKNGKKEPQFAKWNDSQHKQVFERARQITKKYGVKTLTFAVTKTDYDEVVPDELKQYWGKNHYTWAIRQFLDYIHTWERNRGGAPLEYVYDWMKPTDSARREIEKVIAQSEDMSGNTGEFSNYSFRCRDKIPGLQCADILAWTSYQSSLLVFFGKPLASDANIAWNDFKEYLAGEWRTVRTLTRANLEKLVYDEQKSGISVAKFKAWEAKKLARKHGQ